MNDTKFTPYSNIIVKINGQVLTHVISANVKFTSETKSSDSSTEYGEEGISSIYGIKGTCEIVRSKLFSSDLTDKEVISEIAIEKNGYRYILSGCTLTDTEKNAELSSGETEKYIYSVSEGKKVKI